MTPDGGRAKFLFFAFGGWYAWLKTHFLRSTSSARYLQYPGHFCIRWCALSSLVWCTCSTPTNELAGVSFGDRYHAPPQAQCQKPGARCLSTY